MDFILDTSLTVLLVLGLKSHRLDTLDQGLVIFHVVQGSSPVPLRAWLQGLDLADEGPVHVLQRGSVRQLRPAVGAIALRLPSELKRY